MRILISHNLSHITWVLINFSVALGWFLVTAAHAIVSVNVPLGHWSYGAIDKLTTFGLIRSDMRGTRPWTRLEMGRLVLEAESELEIRVHPGPEKESENRVEIIRAILTRLKGEFRAEIDKISFRGVPKDSSIKPVENLYASYLYGDKAFGMENDKGQKYGDGSNIRAGFSTHGFFFDHLGYYFNPEYQFSENSSGGDKHDIWLREGYGKLEFFNIELEGGRDSLWWGTGRHGSLILSSNAHPFDLVKLSNPKPVVLPWLFKYLGLFRFVGFWTELEKERVVPKAELMGFRIDLKPLPSFSIGASKTIMLGGENSGVKGVTDLSFSDWLTVLFKGNAESELNTNQIAGLDGLLRIVDVDRWIPIFKLFELWGEWYGEDEAGGLPSHTGWVAGLKLGDVFLTGRTDLIFEYADNVISGRPGLWYRNSIYRSGYTYKGEIIGHNMGSDARDYYACLEQFLSPNLIFSLGYNRQETGVESPTQEEIDRLDIALRFHRTDKILLSGAYRYERIDNLGQEEGKDQENHIFWVLVSYSF